VIKRRRGNENGTDGKNSESVFIRSFFFFFFSFKLKSAFQIGERIVVVGYRAEFPLASVKRLSYALLGPFSLHPSYIDFGTVLGFSQLEQGYIAATKVGKNIL